MNRLFIISAIAIISCVSCKKTEDQPNEFVNTLFYPPAETSCIESSQIIYHDRLDRQPLSEEQLRKLSEQVRSNDMLINQVWFCRVLYNKSDFCTVDVYFKPTKTYTRTMKGQYFRYEISSSSKIFGGKAYTLSDYMYVATKEQAGSETIPIPSSPQLFPFERPGFFTYQEITEIVDFVRSGPTLKKTDPSIMYPWEKPDTELPIHSIKKLKDGNIEVQTGIQEGPLAGSGQSLTIKKTDDGYELISIGMWLS